MGKWGRKLQALMDLLDEGSPEAQTGARYGRTPGKGSGTQTRVQKGTGKGPSKGTGKGGMTPEALHELEHHGWKCKACKTQNYKDRTRCFCCSVPKGKTEPEQKTRGRQPQKGNKPETGVDGTTSPTLHVRRQSRQILG